MSTQPRSPTDSASEVYAVSSPCHRSFASRCCVTTTTSFPSVSCPPLTQNSHCTRGYPGESPVPPRARHTYGHPGAAGTIALGCKGGLALRICINAYSCIERYSFTYISHTQTLTYPPTRAPLLSAVISGNAFGAHTGRVAARPRLLAPPRFPHDGRAERRRDGDGGTYTPVAPWSSCRPLAMG